jgi:hypothetical protein
MRCGNFVRQLASMSCRYLFFPWRLLRRRRLCSAECLRRVSELPRIPQPEEQAVLWEAIWLHIARYPRNRRRTSSVCKAQRWAGRAAFTFRSRRATAASAVFVSADRPSLLEKARFEFESRGPDYQGIWRLVNFLPMSAACWLAGPTMTPSLIISMTFIGFIEFRKKTLFALVAAKTRARAAFI